MNIGQTVSLLLPFQLNLKHDCIWKGDELEGLVLAVPMHNISKEKQRPYIIPGKQGESWVGNALAGTSAAQLKDKKK